MGYFRGVKIDKFIVHQHVLDSADDSQHPDVLECAVYGVPSELTEDDIMATLVPIEGKKVDPAELPEFLKDKLARFAVPRYYRVVDALPKTETHRVIKKELEKVGVTQDTYDAEGGK